MNITFFELESWQEDFFKKNLKKHKLTFVSSDLNERSVTKAKDADMICVFIYSEVNNKMLSKMPELKAILTMSTGYDHIAVSECKKRGIKVLNVPSYGENTVAEHAFALILSLSRKIPQSYLRTKSADFSLEGLRGFDLKDKTLGILGTGRIGSHVAKMAYGFDMKILASDKYPNKDLIKNYKVKYVPLNTLLKNSDIVTVHVPYIKETHHLLNSKNIPLMKQGAYIINTARGAIIDTAALFKALQKKQIAGAGLDVLEEEEEIKDEKKLLPRQLKDEQNKQLMENHALLSYENVIITPHNAFNSKEALQRIMNTTLENINSVIKGKEINVVEVR